MSNRFYFDRGILAELEYHSNNLDNIQNHLTQNGDGTGTSHGVMLDSVASSLNDMKTHTNLTASRLNNIQNHLTQNGDGTGTSHGVMLDSVASSLNDMKTHTDLTQSRLNNIQNHLTQNGDGTGTSHGVMLDSCASRLGDISSNSTLTASRVLLINTNLEDIETLLTTQATTIASTNTKLDTLETTMNNCETHIEELADGKNSVSTLYSNGSLAAHTFSTTIDMSNHRHLSLFGKTTSTSGTLYLALSTDDTNYYVAPNLSTYVQVLNGVYYFGSNFANIGAKYVRVYSTTLLSNLYMSASMKN